MYVFQQNFQIHIIERANKDNVEAIVRGPEGEIPVQLSWHGASAEGSFMPQSDGQHEVRYKIVLKKPPKQNLFYLCLTHFYLECVHALITFNTLFFGLIAETPK